jgi:hypothetical protein
MPGEKSFSVEGTFAGLPLSLDVAAPPAKGFFDLSVYAPAAPGVIVALAGLYIAHHLTRSRERAKAIGDVCEKLKELTDSAVQSAVDAWEAPPGADRLAKVRTAKRLIQKVGTSATALRNRSGRRGKWNSRFCKQSEIDILQLVSDLRRAATADPFEDPERDADSSRSNNILSAGTIIQTAIDRQYHDKFG